MAPPGSTAMRRRSVNRQAPSLTPIAVASRVAAHFDVGPRGTGSWFDVPDRRAAGAPTPDNEGGRHETLTRSADPSAAVPVRWRHARRLRRRAADLGRPHLARPDLVRPGGNARDRHTIH